MGQPVVHFEMMSKDPAKMSDFYAKLFGWKIKNIPEIKIHVEEQEIPGMGWRSLFTDPEGRMMGLWKAKAAAK